VAIAVATTPPAANVFQIMDMQGMTTSWSVDFPSQTKFAQLRQLLQD
jgi:hypothetical protein